MNIKSVGLRKLGLFGVLAAAGLFTTTAHALNVTVDAATITNGFVNVYDLPANGGAYQFSSGWAVADAVATFSGNTITLAPNSVNDPAPYWYTPAGGPGATGNKIVEALVYAQSDGGLAGTNLFFTGTVVSNSFSSHSVIAFIRDFAPDYSTFVGSSQILDLPGDFSVNFATINDPARHVQYGFATTGATVWITDAVAAGSMVIAPTTVPEPSTYGLIGASMAGVVAVYFRRRKQVA